MQKQEIINKINEIVIEALRCKPEEVNAEATLNDLGADSLDSMEIIMSLETEFNITINIERVNNISTLGQLYNIVEKMTLTHDDLAMKRD